MEFRHDSPNHRDRAICAAKETSEKILTILSSDPHWWVRINVIKNPNTPFNLVQKLAKDSEAWVAMNAKEILIIREPIQRLIPPDSSWEFIEWAEKMDVEVLDKFIHKTQEQIVEKTQSSNKLYFAKIAILMFIGLFLSVIFYYLLLSLLQF
jgi:hypothetical protein